MLAAALRGGNSARFEAFAPTKKVVDDLFDDCVPDDEEWLNGFQDKNAAAQTPTMPWEMDSADLCGFKGVQDLGQSRFSMASTNCEAPSFMNSSFDNNMAMGASFSEGSTRSGGSFLDSSASFTGTNQGSFSPTGSSSFGPAGSSFGAGAGAAVSGQFLDVSLDQLSFSAFSSAGAAGRRAMQLAASNSGSFGGGTVMGPPPGLAPPPAQQLQNSMQPQQSMYAPQAAQMPVPQRPMAASMPQPPPAPYGAQAAQMPVPQRPMAASMPQPPPAPYGAQEVDSVPPPPVPTFCEGGGAQPSIGSCLHASGECTPCKFYRGRRGCKDGAMCNLCHHPHEELTYSGIRRAMRARGIQKRQACAGGAPVEPAPGLSLNSPLAPGMVFSM